MLSLPPLEDRTSILGGGTATGKMPGTTPRAVAPLNAVRTGAGTKVWLEVATTINKPPAQSA